MKPLLPFLHSPLNCVFKQLVFTPFVLVRVSHASHARILAQPPEFSCVHVLELVFARVFQFAPLMIAKLAPQPSPPNEYKCSEPNVSVRDTCAWALGKVVLNAAAEIDDAAVLRLVEVMCACLKDEPRVVVNACYVSVQHSFSLACPCHQRFVLTFIVHLQCLNVLSSELASAERHSLLSPSLPLVIRCLGDAQSRWVVSNEHDVILSIRTIAC